MNFFIERKDFARLNRIKSLNNTSYGNKYANKYDNDDVVNTIRGLIKPIKDKFHILKESIESDLRFSGLEIGISSIRPRGFRFNSYYWLWLVDKKKYRKMKDTKKNSPQLSLPQIQISISSEYFISAELWFEKQAFIDRVKLHDALKKDANLELLKNKYYFEVLTDTPKKYNKLATNKGDTFKHVFHNFINKEYYEAGITKHISIEEASDHGEEIVDSIKNDLFELIENIYEPVYGKILNRSIISVLNNKKLRNEGNVLRKGTMDIEYERKHFKMQNKFKLYYESEGFNVHIEKKRIDAIIYRNNIIELIEMKPYDNVIKTIREALGQIIAYSYIFHNVEKKEIHLTIAGLEKPDKTDITFINFLKSKIQFNLRYLFFDYKKEKIVPVYY